MRGFTYEHDQQFIQDNGLTYCHKPKDLSDPHPVWIMQVDEDFAIGDKPAGKAGDYVALDEKEGKLTAVAADNLDSLFEPLT